LNTCKGFVLVCFICSEVKLKKDKIGKIETIGTCSAKRQTKLHMVVARIKNME
jgi:hypothetical protein